MGRTVHNTAVMAKIETTYGVDAAPTGVANAMLVSEVTHEYLYSNVDRTLIKGYMGSDAQLPGVRFVQLGLNVELSAAGAAGTAPAWGVLLKSCAMAETITAGSRVEYSPVTTSKQSCTIYYQLDGVLHKALGCMGTVQLAMGVGERPMLNFTFTGLDGGLAETANAAQTLTAWKAPQIITDINSDGLKLGGSYSAGTITGGTPYASRGINLDLGNEVKQLDTLGQLEVDIDNRSITGQIQLELSAANEVSFITDVNGIALTSLSFEHGTAAGSKILLFAPSVQRTNPRRVTYEGRPHMTFDLRVLPLAGNDDLRIVVA